MYAINDRLNKTKKLLNENRTTVRILFMYFSFQMAKALFFAPDRLLLLWLKLWIVIDNHDNDNAYQLSNYHQHRCTREIHRKTHWCCWQHASSFSISTNDLLLLCWINAHLSKVCESEYRNQMQILWRASLTYIHPIPSHSCSGACKPDSLIR